MQEKFSISTGSCQKYVLNPPCQEATQKRKDILQAAAFHSKTNPLQKSEANYSRPFCCRLVTPNSGLVGNPPGKSTLNSGLVVICPVQILQLEDPGSPLKTPAGGGSRERKMFWRLPPKLVKLLLWLDRPAESVLQVGIVGFCL